MKFIFYSSLLTLVALELIWSVGAGIRNIQTSDSERDKAVVQRIQEISAELNLTDEQKEKIRPILIKEAPKVKAIREDTSMLRLQKLAKLRAILNDTNAQLKPILTAEQAKKLQKIKEDAIRKYINGKS